MNYLIGIIIVETIFIVYELILLAKVYTRVQALHTKHIQILRVVMVRSREIQDIIKSMKGDLLINPGVSRKDPSLGKEKGPDKVPFPLN